MGWISNRKHKTGHGLNSSPQNNGSDKGPLRVIVKITGSSGSGIFDHDFVEFECGHTGCATMGARRGRCTKCKALAAKGE